MSPTLWPDGPIAGLDFEATGTDPRQARPLEVSLILDPGDGRPPATGIDTLIDPGPDVPIPEIVTTITGIDRDRLDREAAMPARAAIRQTVDLLADLYDRDVPVAIYNATYDLPLLEAETARHSIPMPPVTVIDPLVLDRHVDRYRKGKRTLEAAARVYGVELDGAHRAGADVTATIAVVRKIAAAEPGLAGLTLDELTDLQRTAYVTWRDSYNQYRARQGQEPIPEVDWPGITLEVTP